MKLYKQATTAAVNRFLRHELSYPDCIATLDAALSNLVPRMSDDQLPTLRAVMLKNNEVVMTEMERRGPPRQDS